MYSPDRILYGVHVRQETQTGFLNLSDLQEAYNKARNIHGWVEKNLTMILTSNQNLERIYYLLEKQNIIKLSFLSFMEEVKIEGIAKTLKKYNAYKTTGSRESKITWCNPYLWVLIAMEMNPILYAEVVTWLTDKLILNRIEAGDLYKGLTSSVARFRNVDYGRLAKALNYIIFNKHEPGIRNLATEKQLKELDNLEREMAFAIDKKKKILLNSGIKMRAFYELIKSLY